MDYLKKPLRARLSQFRKNLDGFRRYPMAYGGMWTNDGRTLPRHTDGTVHDSNFGGHGLRFVGASHSILSRLRHRGWYTDSFQSESCFGIVYRLPNGRGFLAGYTDPWNSNKDGSGPHSLDWTCSYATPEEAARAGDSMAERYAEECREDDAKQQAEAAIEQEREDIKTARERFRHLAAGIRESRLAPAVCDEMRSAIRGIRREIRDSVSRIRELQKDPWKAVA